MDIRLFQDDEPQHFEQIILYPYPDLQRIWVRAWISAVQNQAPNVELQVLNPDGSENNSITLISHSDSKVDSTLHLRHPQPGATYTVIAELSLGIGAEQTRLDRREFEMVLEFRNPEANAMGFGIGFAQSGPSQAGAD